MTDLLEKVNKHDLIRVSWSDILVSWGWRSSGYDPPANCVSYGFLTDYGLAKTGEYIVMSATKGFDPDGSVEYNQHITIPIANVFSYEIIKEAEA